MDATMDTLVIEIQSSSRTATQAVGKLVNGLKTLKNELKSVVDESKKFSQLKNNLSGISVRTQSNLGKIKLPTEKRDTQLERLGVNPSDLNVDSAISSISKSDGTVIERYKDSLGRLVVVTKKVKDGVESFSTSVKTTSPNVETLSKKLDKITNIFDSVKAKVTATVAGLTIMANKIADLVYEAGAEQEALNLFTVSMGKYAKEGVDWVTKFSNALYLDPTALMQYMGSFNSLIEGLGVGSEKSYLMSKNMTQLVYDLSSFKNISIESAYEKLMSGISGELEPLRNIGVALSETTLQTLAYSLGIDKLVRNMTEAEKAQLRYIQIMRSSTEWQTDMGRTLVTPANALRIMKQQFVQLGRAIGKIFIPIVMELMPYVIAFTQLLTALAEKIAKFFGYKVVDIDYSNLEKISSGITGIGDSADSTTKKLNTMLAPFDDLNVVQTNKANDKSGLGGLGGDLGVELPTYDALANLDKRFAENVENAKAKLESILPIVVAIGAGFALWKIGSGLFDAIGFISMFAEGGTIATGISTITGGLSGLGTALAPVIAPLIVIVAVITSLILGLKKVYDTNEKIRTQVETQFGKIGDTLKSSFSIITETVIPDLENGVESLKKVFEPFTDFLNTVFTDIWQSVIIPLLQKVSEDIIPGLTKVFTTLWNDALVPLGKFLTDTLSPAVSVISDVLSYLWQNIVLPFAEAIIDIFGEAFKTLTIVIEKSVAPAFNFIIGVFEVLWNVVKTVADSVATVLGPVFKSVVESISEKIEFMKNIIKGILQFIQGVFTGDWKSAWEGVVNVFSNIFGMIGTVIKTPINVAISLLEGFLNKIIKGYNGLINVVNKVPGVNISTAGKVSLGRFENGGFPNKAELFFANENGIPEMVGRIGNQTAVANNDQITTSITNALISALNQYDFGGGQSPTTIYIGNKKVYEGYGDYVSGENDRYGTNTISI